MASSAAAADFSSPQWRQITAEADNSVFRVMVRFAQRAADEPFRVADEGSKSGSSWVYAMRDRKGQPAKRGNADQLESMDVVTNGHVVADAVTIYLEHPELSNPMPAELLGLSPASQPDPGLGLPASGRDVAVLRVRLDTLKGRDRQFQFHALEMGSSATLEAGDFVATLGFPLGLPNRVPTEGLMSGRQNISGRTMLGISAPINPGSSGSPLLDTRGRVLGMNTIGFPQAQNMGFAVPGQEVQRIVELICTLADRQRESSPTKSATLLPEDADADAAKAYRPPDGFTAYEARELQLPEQRQTHLPQQMPPIVVQDPVPGLSFEVLGPAQRVGLLLRMEKDLESMLQAQLTQKKLAPTSPEAAALRDRFRATGDQMRQQLQGLQGLVITGLVSSKPELARSERQTLADVVHALVASLETAGKEKAKVQMRTTSSGSAGGGGGARFRTVFETLRGDFNESLLPDEILHLETRPWVGDIITGFDGRPILEDGRIDRGAEARSGDLRLMTLPEYMEQMDFEQPFGVSVFRLPFGSVVLRGHLQTGNTLEGTMIPVRDRVPFVEADQYEFLRGMVVAPLSMNLVRTLGERNPALGVYARLQNRLEPRLVVAHVINGSPLFGEKSPLPPGTLLVGANGRPLRTLLDLRQVVLAVLKAAGGASKETLPVLVLETDSGTRVALDLQQTAQLDRRLLQTLNFTPSPLQVAMQRHFCR